MLATRIIPTLLKRGDQLVKGQRFNAWRSVGHVEQAARIHQARGVDELCILDIAATPEGRGPDVAAIERLTDGCFMPLSVGGGVRTLEHVRALLRAGADKVVIRSGGYALVEEVSAAVGRQAVVAALDANSLSYDWARVARNWEAAGAGEIMLTRMEREGTLQGYDVDLIREVSAAVGIPVIAHGGCGTYQHMVEAVKAGASAVAAGAMFQFTDATPIGAARYLAKHGIEARV